MTSKPVTIQCLTGPSGELCLTSSTTSWGNLWADERRPVDGMKIPRLLFPAVLTHTGQMSLHLAALLRFKASSSLRQVPTSASQRVAISDLHDHFHPSPYLLPTLYKEGHTSSVHTSPYAHTCTYTHTCTHPRTHKQSSSHSSSIHPPYILELLSSQTKT